MKDILPPVSVSFALGIAGLFYCRGGACMIAPARDVTLDVRLVWEFSLLMILADGM